MGLYCMRNYPGALARHQRFNQGGKSWIEADYGKPLTKDKKELGEIGGSLVKFQEVDLERWKGGKVER